MNEEKTITRTEQLLSFESQCKNKKPHATETEAIQVARKSVMLSPQFNFTVYRCPWCGMYHVGRVWKE